MSNSIADMVERGITLQELAALVNANEQLALDQKADKADVDGVAASGTIKLDVQPTEGQTLEIIPGKLVVFTASPSDANDVEIGVTLAGTIDNLKTFAEGLEEVAKVEAKQV